MLANTLRLADVKAADYDAVFYPGGHGPMWDLAEDPHSIALIEAFYNAGKPVAAVCHAPGVLHRVQFQGQPIVKGKRVTGFTNGEEEAVHLTKVVPFLVEDELKRLGGLYEKAADWVPLRRHRREARHRPEPGLVPGGGRGAAETPGLRGPQCGSGQPSAPSRRANHPHVTRVRIRAIPPGNPVSTSHAAEAIRLRCSRTRRPG